MRSLKIKTLVLTGIALLSVSCSTSEPDDSPESKPESLVSYDSDFSVQETADRFEEIAKGKGLTLFTRVDHQKNASGVDLELRPTVVIIFGNPKVGTPLMQCEQNVAIDLPQKVLVSEDANNQVRLSYNNPEYLRARHNIEGCDEIIEKISNVLSQLSQAAVAQEAASETE